MTMPASLFCLKCCACLSEPVQMPEDRPNGVSLATASASS